MSVDAQRNRDIFIAWDCRYGDGSLGLKAGCVYHRVLAEVSIEDENENSQYPYLSRSQWNAMPLSPLSPLSVAARLVVLKAF